MFLAVIQKPSIKQQMMKCTGGRLSNLHNIQQLPCTTDMWPNSTRRTQSKPDQTKPDQTDHVLTSGSS